MKTISSVLTSVVMCPFYFLPIIITLFGFTAKKIVARTKTALKNRLVVVISVHFSSSQPFYHNCRASIKGRQGRQSARPPSSKNRCTNTSNL